MLSLAIFAATFWQYVAVFGFNYKTSADLRCYGALSLPFLLFLGWFGGNTNTEWFHFEATLSLATAVKQNTKWKPKEPRLQTNLVCIFCTFFSTPAKNSINLHAKPQPA